MRVTPASGVIDVKTVVTPMVHEEANRTMRQQQSAPPLIEVLRRIQRDVGSYRLMAQRIGGDPDLFFRVVRGQSTLSEQSVRTFAAIYGPAYGFTTNDALVWIGLRLTSEDRRTEQPLPTVQPLPHVSEEVPADPLLDRGADIPASSHGTNDNMPAIRVQVATEHILAIPEQHASDEEQLHPVLDVGHATGPSHTTRDDGVQGDGQSRPDQGITPNAAEATRMTLPVSVTNPIADVSPDDHTMNPGRHNGEGTHTTVSLAVPPWQQAMPFFGDVARNRDKPEVPTGADSAHPHAMPTWLSGTDAIASSRLGERLTAARTQLAPEAFQALLVFLEKQMDVYLERQQVTRVPVDAEGTSGPDAASPATSRHRPTGPKGGVYHRKDGRWVAAVDLGYENGKRKRKFVYTRTREEADEEFARILQQAAVTGTLTSDTDPPATDLGTAPEGPPGA